MAEKIGVFICECGPNIKDAVDLGELVEFSRGLKDVVFVRQLGVFCSADGQERIKNDIQEQKLTRVVIAACSPKEHEETFKKVLAASGLNPFLLQIANIREQCAWVTKNQDAALQKAKTIIRSAVKRVVYNEPLEVKEIACCSDVLVVGAGITGISAALTLAQKNRKVYLLDKLPVVGGKVARYGEVFPAMECAPCMLDPKLDEVLHHERVEVLTYAAVEDVAGFYGNFTVKVNKKARCVDMKACIGCGACVEACPVKVRNEYSEGMDQRKAIYIPYAGALPNIAVIDKKNCLRFNGKACDACQKACPFAAINYDEADCSVELKVGAVVVSTGFDLFDAMKAPQYGYGKVDNVYTALEFERILSTTGPSGGNILLKDGKPPQKIALVHCVGSRVKNFDQYCSGVCCAYLFKFSHLIKAKLADASLTHFYADICLPGKKAQNFFDHLIEEKAIQLIRMKSPDAIEITQGNAKIVVKCQDASGQSLADSFDMVILAPAIEGALDAAHLAELFDLSRGQGGFFAEEHDKLAPVSTTTEGVFIAGCAQSPMDIQGSVAQGQAAAGRILSRLVPGEKLTLEARVSVIDEDICSGCKTCIVLCPYKAISYDDKKKRSAINEALCRGCGVCVAACPSSAIKAKHFTDKQITEEVKGLLKEE